MRIWNLLRFVLDFLVLVHVIETEGVSFLGGITTNVDANEGGSAYIRCAFQNRDSRTQTPAWQRSDTTISQNADIEESFKDKERFKVIQPTEIDDYNLIIDPVERSDGEYEYKCVVFENEKIILFSDPITLNIKQLPGIQYPAFEPLSDKYQMNDEIKIVCFTEKTENTESKLTLYKDTKRLRVKASSDETYQKITYKFTARPEDNSKSFRCNLVNTILEEGRNKTTGLINIEYKPNVSIFEPEEVLENKEAIFICRSDSNPMKVTYEWKFSKHLREDEYKVEEGSEQILRIKKPNKGNNGTKITCQVRNDVGIGNFTATLHVLKQRQSETSPLATQSPDVPLNEMTLAIIIATAGGFSVLIILIIILPMYYRYLRNCLFQPNIDITATQLAQPDIYFEPKDSIRPPLPTPDHVEQWRISVGIQVCPESNEHSYTEVGGNSSKGSDIIYGGSINDAATATYRSKSVYV